jgi:hypothetical protein
MRYGAPLLTLLLAAPALGQGGLEVVQGRVGMIDADQEHIIQIGETVYALPDDTPGAATVKVGQQVRAVLEPRTGGIYVLKLEPAESE